MATNPGPTSQYRVVQIHPLLTCNLRCRHCYSSSSPQGQRALPLPKLTALLDLLRREGFNAVGLSGGEPMLYQELPALLDHARALGMATTVTTNAMLVTAAKAKMLRRGADLVAVSLDGIPESHNRVRGHARAFERMVEGVAHLRAAGIPFGFIFTLTFHNLHELAWVAEFAVSQGAALLQVHPLEEVGRATEQCQGAAPDAIELARGFVEVARLREKHHGQLTIQYDVADVEVLLACPERGFANEPSACQESRAPQGKILAELIAPIVVEADGRIVPLQYHFGRHFQLGNLHADDLAGQFAGWKETRFPQFLALCRRVRDALVAQSANGLPFANWYGAVLQASQEWQKPEREDQDTPSEETAQREAALATSA